MRPLRPADHPREPRRARALRERSRRCAPPDRPTAVRWPTCRCTGRRPTPRGRRRRRRGPADLRRPGPPGRHARDHRAFFFLPFVTPTTYRAGSPPLVGSVQPVIVIVLAAVLVGGRVRAVYVTACAAAAVGVGLRVLRSDATLDPVGVAAATGAAVCMATGIVLTKRWRRPVGVLLFTGWQLAAGGLVLLPALVLLEGLPGADAVDGDALLGFGYLISGRVAPGLQRVVPGGRPRPGPRDVVPGLRQPDRRDRARFPGPRADAHRRAGPRGGGIGRRDRRGPARHTSGGSAGDGTRRTAVAVRPKG